jgi:TPP-dependent pyruvate/acetoin dehydrogenase alpha subunit
VTSIQRLGEADQAFAALSPKPFHLPVAGLEAVVAGGIAGLGKGDWWLPGLRERVGAVLRDVPASKLVEPNVGASSYKVAPADSSPANRALWAVGLAMTGTPALVHLGVGSASDGAFYEALNLAALHRPAVIFLVAVHPLGEDAPLGPQIAASPSALARALGIPATEVDGHDVDAITGAVAAARKSGGPHVVEARL